MNFDHLGEIMGRDPDQLSDWLSGTHNPFKIKKLSLPY
jgi:hypothetical protein